MSTTSMVKFVTGGMATLVATSALVAPRAAAEAATSYTFIGQAGGGDDHEWDDAGNWFLTRSDWS